jgi:hypothetical protein
VRRTSLDKVRLTPHSAGLGLRSGQGHIARDCPTGLGGGGGGNDHGQRNNDTGQRNDQRNDHGQRNDQRNDHGQRNDQRNERYDGGGGGGGRDRSPPPRRATPTVHLSDRCDGCANALTPPFSDRSPPLRAGDARKILCNELQTNHGSVGWSSASPMRE